MADADGAAMNIRARPKQPGGFIEPGVGLLRDRCRL
jgi:hypothetical protein